MNRKTLILSSAVATLVCLITAAPVFAQVGTATPIKSSDNSIEQRVAADATAAGIANTASTSSNITKIIEQQFDLTEPTPQIKGELQRFLDENPVGPLNVFNFVRYAIREAVTQGVPINTLVLVLLFPLVAAWVAFTRHILGLTGFGIFTPAILSVALTATGVLPGLAIFSVIIAAAVVAQAIFRRIKLLYLPRTAIVIWFVSVAIFALFAISAIFSLSEIVVVSIFPILILILLTESFMEIQTKEGMRQALSRTVVTVLVAIGGYLILNFEMMQQWALLQPELLLLLVAILDISIGRYMGLRVLEYYRFRQIIKAA